MALLLSASAYADQVTPSQALALAQQFMAHCNQGTQDKASAKKAKASQPRLKLAYTATDSRLYAFNRGTQEGYVIVSGDDATAPVIGYSDHGSFDPDHMPDGMRYWLSECERQIAYAAKTGVKYSAATSTQDATSQDWAVIGPLLKTHWDQGAPYNKFTPVQDDQHCYTGCVATALSQVINYFKYPAQVKGKGLGKFSSQDLSQYTLDWANILDEYTDSKGDPLGTTTEAQDQAVARLMVAAGYSVDMRYSTSGSDAYHNKVPFAAVQNFSFDAAIHMDEPDCYDAATWTRMVYENLANCGPMLYGGASEEGMGHSFVCDGYAGNGFFHFNWGWSGKYDGNFLLTALNPSETRTYNYHQLVIFGMRPPVDGSKPYHGVLFEEYRPVVKNVDGKLQLGGSVIFLINEPTVFELALQVKNEATGEVIYHSLGERTVAVPAYNGDPLSLHVGNLPDGLYTITPMYRVKADGDDYHPIKFYRYFGSGALELTVQGGVQTFGNKQPFCYDEKKMTIDGKLASQGVNYASVWLLHNGSIHASDLHAVVLDEETLEKVGESQHVRQEIDLSSPRVVSLSLPINTGQLDLSHTYSVVLYDGDEELYRIEGKQATTRPTVEVMEPLCSPSIVDGKIWNETEVMHLTAKLRNVSGNPVKDLHISSVSEDGNAFDNIYKNESPRVDGDIIEIDEDVDMAKPLAEFSFVEGDIELTLHLESDGPDFVTTEGKPLKLKLHVVEDDPTTAIAQVTAKPGAISQLSLYTADGKLVKTIHGQALKAGQASLQSLPSGIYITRTVYADGSVKHAKVVKK